MSTRSSIAILRVDGTMSQVYCHSDGYLSWNGALLYEHYKNAYKVEKIMTLGDMSSLAEEVDIPVGQTHSFEYGERAEGVSVFYGRDRGEEGIEARQFSNFEEFKKDGDFQEYDYVFKEKNQTWYLFNQTTEKLQKLRNLLVKEQKDSERVRQMFVREATIQAVIDEENVLAKSIESSKPAKKKKEVKI